MTILSLFNNFLIAAACICCLAACSTSKMASPEEANRLRSMSPTSETALVYFVRPSKVGSLVPMPVTCDKIEAGSTRGKQYIYMMLKPGKHDFVSEAENKDELTMVVEAGKTYFIEQKPTMGLIMARNKIERINETAGREKLAKCKLSDNCPAYSTK